MREVLLAGVGAMMLFSPLQEAFAQPASLDAPSLRQEGLAGTAGTAPQDTVEFVPEPIVIETDLFTIELDVGVFFETYCHKPASVGAPAHPATINPCVEIFPLLEKHRLMSDIATAVRRRMEEEVEGIKEEVEANYRQAIRRNLERQAGDLVNQEQQRER